MIYDLQKASLLKRASAFLLDAILLVVLASGFFLLIGSITNFDKHLEVYNEAYSRIGAEYGITPELQSKTPEQMTEEEKKLLNDADDALVKDPAVVSAYQMLLTLPTIMVSIGLLCAFLVLEFAVPLLLHNGQTVGKKIFGIAVMHTEGVRISHMPLFVRTVLGKYAVETMPIAMTIMYIFFGIGSPVFALIALALLLAQVITLIATRENALLHDKMAVTVAVDLASQMIFDTREQMLEYKKKAHAQKVASSVY